MRDAASDCDVHLKMFQHNPKAKHESNRGRYLQILSGKDLYKQMIVISINVSSDDIFSVSFPNIFDDYPLWEMRIGNKSWTNWNKLFKFMADTVER